MTKLQVIKQSFSMIIDQINVEVLNYFYFLTIFLFSGKLTDAFSSLAKKSHFRALSRKLNLVCIFQDFPCNQSAENAV